MLGELAAAPQDEAAVTYCRTLTKADGHLGADMTAIEAERAVRAFAPWPGAYVEFRGERIAVWRARVDRGHDEAPGQANVCGKLPAVSFRDGWLVLEEVQRPGSRRMTGAQYLNGLRGDWSGTVVLR